MVSNQELKERLYEKRTGSRTKEYLVCDTCKGSYELQPGEKPGDFSSECECGGKLTYNRDISSSDKDKRRNRIILGAAIIVVFMVFVFPVLAAAGGRSRVPECLRRPRTPSRSSRLPATGAEAGSVLVAT